MKKEENKKNDNWLLTENPAIIFEDNSVGRLKKQIWDASEEEIENILKEYEIPSESELGKAGTYIQNTPRYKVIEKRRKNASLYREFLREVPVILPVEKPGCRHVYHLYVIRVNKRDEVHRYLAEKGIETGIHYPIALPNLLAYRHLGYKPEDFPIASINSQEILSLPMYAELEEQSIEYVCRSLMEVVKKYS